jgi:hypothetical protein
MALGGALFAPLPRVESLDDGRDVGDLIQADEGIDLGQGAGQVLGEALGHAAGDDQLLRFPALAQAALPVCRENVADRLLF